MAENIYIIVPAEKQPALQLVLMAANIILMPLIPVNLRPLQHLRQLALVLSELINALVKLYRSAM
jgi:hypothetical protein